jgi:hypothetical protein
VDTFSFSYEIGIDSPWVDLRCFSGYNHHTLEPGPEMGAFLCYLAEAPRSLSGMAPADPVPTAPDDA